MAYQTRVLKEPPVSEHISGAWNDLFAGSESATPFQSLAWQESWWETFGGGKQPHTFTLWSGNELLGIMPMYVKPGMWRTLRTAGTGVSDYLSPLVRPGIEQDFANALYDHLGSEKSIDLIDLHQIREGNALLQRSDRAQVMEQARCCVLDLPTSFDDYLQTLSKSLRYDVRAINRGAFANGEASIRSVAKLEELESALSHFFRLHGLRWRKRGLPGAFALSKTKTFHLRFAKRALASGLLRLSLLENRGEVVGAIYAMRAGSRYFFYQSGFDPSYKSLCPGTVLVGHTIRLAIEEGADQFDFLRGDEDYKRRWKPQHTYSNMRLILPAQGLRGSWGLGWNQMGNRVENRIRARLEGRGLTS